MAECTELGPVERLPTADVPANMPLAGYSEWAATGLDDDAECWWCRWPWEVEWLIPVGGGM